MKSPKFQFSIGDINKSINERALRKAWKTKLGAQLRNQVILDLVEYRDYTANVTKVARTLANEVSSARYLPRRPVHYLVEKSRGLCRQMTLGHPRDMLVLQALSGSLHRELKASAPTNRAFFEPGSQKFGQKKLSISLAEYGAIASWKRFQKAIFEFSKENKYIVVTDVANFYDFINFNHLRNIIASQCDVKEATLDFLIFILNEISWTPDFMPRTEIGLPQMELEAPRVLANAMLFELDKVANDHALGDYVRFMDDIDVGVDSIAQAKRVVKDIDLTLQSRQLRLNASKTEILSTTNGDAARHFCIKENYILDKVAGILEGNPTPREADAQARHLRRLYRLWRGGDWNKSLSDRSRFFEGNGEKIFKRLTKFLEETGQRIEDRDLIWLIRNRPSLRSFAFNALVGSRHANDVLAEVEEIMSDGLFIDDAAFADFGKFLVHAVFRDDKKFRLAIRRIVGMMCSLNEYFGFQASVVIASKFYEPKEILALITNNEQWWQDDVWLARAVGGLAPIMVDDPAAYSEYQILLQRAASREALAVFEFHREIWEQEYAVEREYKYVSSANPTFPRGIIHSKALIIKSVLRNKKVKNIKVNIIKKHAALRQDPYYRRWYRARKA